MVRRVTGALALAIALPFAMAGCGTANSAAASANAEFSVSPGISSVDTNCTGCNATDAHGNSVLRFAARLERTKAGRVTWSVSGGDAKAGPGTINAEGEYTPPSYLGADHAEVLVTAQLASDPGSIANARITIRPGFLEPVSPENVTLSPGSSVTLKAKLAQAGGQGDVRFMLADSARGSSGGVGTLGVPVCQHDRKAFTTCSITYKSPATPVAAQATYLVAASGESRTSTEILISNAGVNSNPEAHRGLLTAAMPLGSSGGNNRDFDTQGDSVVDCCSGTLGSLVRDGSGNQFILSNNHVLARSDRGTVGDRIIQPGLIDNNCTPNGDGPGTLPVATLSDWLPLRAASTNVDAAIAQVGSGMVTRDGSILELGSRQGDGTLSAAPPGVSSSEGRGETPLLQMRVAKSGRTTGLTCARVTAVDLDVSVDYFRDCAETRPYLTKIFRNQMGISGDRFSDAGDSGALVVDTGNAEPVGLYFAGGADSTGASQGVANPARDVLTQLEHRAGTGARYSFVGTTDHAVSCLNYGDSTQSVAQRASLTDSEIARSHAALLKARTLVDPAAGVLGVAVGKSTDHVGESAVLVYVDEHANPVIPNLLNGVRTVVIPASAQAVSLGTAPLFNTSAATLSSSALTRALDVKRRRAQLLLAQNSGFFGVGVGQSLDDPREAALVIYVDRQRSPAQMPASLDGIRTRYVVMDRLHVTRSYLPEVPSSHRCAPGPAHSEKTLLPGDRNPLF